MLVNGSLVQRPLNPLTIIYRCYGQQCWPMVRMAIQQSAWRLTWKMFMCAINSIGKSHFAFFFKFRTLYVVTYKMRRGVRTLFRTLYIGCFRIFALRIMYMPSIWILAHFGTSQKYFSSISSSIWPVGDTSGYWIRWYFLVISLSFCWHQVFITRATLC